MPAPLFAQARETREALTVLNFAGAAQNRSVAFCRFVNSVSAASGPMDVRWSIVSAHGFRPAAASQIPDKLSGPCDSKRLLDQVGDATQLKHEFIPH